MTIATAIFIVLSVFVATFIQRVTGFGFGIVFMSVAPYFLPSYGEATALSGLMALLCSVVTGAQYFKHVDWKKLLPILVTFCIISFFAVTALVHIDEVLIKHILGYALIALSLYFIFINGNIHLKPSIPVQAGLGSISGVMGGFFGMQGPPAVIYFISCAGSKEQYMALTQWYFAIGNVAMTLYRARSGFVTPTVGEGALIGAGAVLLGLWAGGCLFRRMPIDTIRRIIYIFIGIAGIAAILY